MHKPRTVGCGGGVAIFHRKDILTIPLSIPTFHSFEHLVFKLSDPTPLVTTVIYRPPNPNPDFLFNLAEFLTLLCASSPAILLLGNFNIHIDSTDCNSSTKFLKILNYFNIIQQIDFPTHRKGHTLDLVYTSGIIISNLSSTDLTISDHLAITLDIDLPTPLPKQKRSISFHNLKSLNPTPLSSSLVDASPSSLFHQVTSTTELVNTYNNLLSSCLNDLAPVKTKSVSFSHSAPWYTDEPHHLKAKVHQLE
ncbi:hypothetical protein LDENG_00210350 [Lucifuga dentata]|nr:hypothetical protein LDENG_00210350 [Lucifuga dentata]